MQRRVNKQGKRNVVFRFILAKSDKDKIAAWNQDLVRILHVFNVRSLFCWEPGNLGVLFQTELVIDTNLRVTNTETMVADTKTTVTNTETMVADMHRNMLTGQKAGSGKNNSVGATCYPRTTERLPVPSLNPGQR